MKQDLAQEIEQLLADGKQDEARAVLREALMQPLSDEERGALLVGFAAAYLALQSSVNEMHRDILTEEVETLEKISSLQNSIDENLALVKARQGLNE
ncbi:MAG: hypothetical protein Q7R88_00160 [bacterium]|nr:hypothetical protein [bacterium]